MPELPEVETVRRTLEPFVLDRTISRVEVLYPRVLQSISPQKFTLALVGNRFTSLTRRGKYLLFTVSTGLVMVVHLRMTGRLVAMSSSEVPREKHTSAVFTFSAGGELRFIDQRKFGTINLLPPDRLTEVRGLREMGPEPLGDGFTPAYLARVCEGKKAPIKSVLLDQRQIAGLGNIYADESLFAAGIHPMRPAGELRPGEVERLYDAIRTVLTDAVANQGTTFRDYRTGIGTEGSFQNKLQVYGRKGLPCPNCGQTLQHARVGGRTSHFCPHCQGGPEQ
ncbi:MAG: DNA-formamidopyrimidine glycosylase [Limnochordia bacterium]